MRNGKRIVLPVKIVIADDLVKAVLRNKVSVAFKALALVTNNTGETLRVGILSNKGDPGAAIYPDSDKVGVFPPNKLFRMGDAVDYWDGET